MDVSFIEIASDTMRYEIWALYILYEKYLVWQI